MVDTPTFAAIASKSAISASDRPGTCWRVSAQNHCATGARARPSASRRASASRGGRASAPPISRAASIPNPAISPCPHAASAPDSASSVTAPAACSPPRRAMPRRAAAHWPAAASAQSPTAPRRRHRRAAHGDAQTRQPPDGPQRQLPRDIGAIKPAQRRRHIGQQCRRHDIAQRHADHPPASASSRQFRRHQRDQPPQRRAQRAQGAHHRWRRCSNARPMAPCTMNSPTAKDRRPKAVRFRWKLSVRRATSPPSCGGIRAGRGHAVQRHPAQGLVLRHQQPVHLPRAAQQALRHADIGDRGIGGGVGRHHPLRARFGQPRQRVGAGERAAPDPEERAQIAPSAGATGPMPPGAVSGFDPHQPHAVQIALDHGRDVPARPAQRDVDVLRDRAPSRAGRSGQTAFAQRRRRRVIAGPRLGVDRLHARPQRRGQRQPRQQRDQLQRVAPPMRGQRRQDGPRHVSNPARRCSRRSSRAASRSECVTITSPAPVSATSPSTAGPAPYRPSPRPDCPSAHPPAPAGLRRQRAGDGHALLLAARKLFGVFGRCSASPSRRQRAGRGRGHGAPPAAPERRCWRPRSATGSG
jgi:hypothetical protein